MRSAQSCRSPIEVLLRCGIPEADTRLTSILVRCWVFPLLKNGDLSKINSKIALEPSSDRGAPIERGCDEASSSLVA